MNNIATHADCNNLPSLATVVREPVARKFGPVALPSFVVALLK